MTPIVAVRINGDPLRANFKNARQSFDERMMAALQRTAELAQHYGRVHGLYVNHTYNLRSSTTAFVINGMGGTSSMMPSVRLQATAEYAQFVNDGAAGRNGYRRGRHFMEFSRDRTTPTFERLVGEAFVRAFA